MKVSVCLHDSINQSFCPAACTDNAYSNLSVAHIVLLLKAYRSILDPYRHSARIIEACDLDYTMLRSAWLNGRDEIDDATTKKASLSRMPPKSYRAKARPALVLKLAMTPGLKFTAVWEFTKPRKSRRH